jgi:hypothetical protein
MFRNRERADSEAVQRDAEAKRIRLLRIAADIRRMTKLYVEREKGRQRDA